MSTKKTVVEEVPEEETEYTGLVYNQWWNITGNFVVKVAEGGTFIMQTGRPSEPPTNPPKP